MALTRRNFQIIQPAGSFQDNLSFAMEKLTNRYELGQTLGTGAFSEVKSAVDKLSGDKVAIKIIDRAKCAGKEAMILSEVAILKKVQHENIISLIDMIETETKIYLIMELVTGGELFDNIVARGHYSEEESAFIVSKILSAVDYLHDLGIAHRDLKPENLMFSDRGPKARIVIGDFGLSKLFNDEEVMKTACGTPGYVAPEVLKRQGYSAAVDLWSIGVITYILLVGYPPFYEENNVALFGAIMKGQYEFDTPYWDNISNEAKQFISHLLVVDPLKRMDAKTALKHQWITKFAKHTDSADLMEAEANSEDFDTSELETDDEADSKINSKIRQGTAYNLTDVAKGANKESQVQPVIELSAITKIRFLSYNLFIRPPLVKNNRSDYKDARLQMFIDHFINDYDVIAMQEVNARGSSRQKKLINAANKAGLIYYIRSSPQGLLKGIVDGGLIILSRFPFSVRDRITYEKGINQDRFRSKGAVYAHIHLDGKIGFHLFNTHLQSTTNVGDPNDPTISKRQQQFQQLRSFILTQMKSAITGSDPIIIAGDFNVNARVPKESSKHSAEYVQMMNILRHGRMDDQMYAPDTKSLSITDVFYEKFKEHPITFGDSGERSAIADATGQDRLPEKVLTERAAIGTNQSLDYLFMIESSINPCISVKNIGLNYFRVKNQEFTHLSDHYGIKAEFEVNRKK